MKKIAFIILLFVGLSSCGYHIPLSESIDYEIVDTLDIYNRDHPFIMTNYFVIIKMDGSYYSAKANESGSIYSIVRKLKIKD